jgi:ribosome-binding factor A
MGIRRDRLTDGIRDIIANCFQAGILSDPRLQSVTITAVKLSPDLQVATVYFTSHEADIQEALKGLNSASGFLRKQLAEQLDVRRVPTLRFFFDESIERASRIEDLLRQI